MNMKRQSTKKVVTIDISADDDLTLEPLDLSIFSGGVLEMPAAITACSLGFKVSADEDGTPVALYDHDGNLVQISSPTAALAYELPPELFACRYVWIWSQNGSGTNTAQAADRSFTISLKS